MATTILTIEDLQEFKKELFSELNKLLNGTDNKSRKWLKSQEVRKMLNISPGTLQNLRSSGVLPYTRVGNALYYLNEDIVKILDENRVHHKYSR